MSATLARSGWQGLFATAFRQSRNAMALTDDRRRFVEVNGAFVNLLGYRPDAVIGREVAGFVVGGPLLTDAEWEAALAGGSFTGEAEMIRADGGVVGVQWAASTQVATGRRLVLFEQEVVRLVAFGWTGREIADELRISEDTVRTHVRNALRKAQARSRAHLVARAVAGGLALE